MHPSPPDSCFPHLTIAPQSVPGFGNVGQLALDVLIASSKATLAARVDCGDDVVALVCPDPYQEDSSEPHTAVELYHASDAPVSLLQIRAGIKKVQSPLCSAFHTPGAVARHSLPSSSHHP